MAKINFNLNDSAVSKFGLRRKRLVSSYGSTAETLRSIRGSKGGRGSESLRDLTGFVTGDQLDRFFARPGKSNEEAATLSHTLYQTNLVYSKIIDYYKDMYYWRYVTTPRRIGSKKANKKEYKEMYEKMLELIDGMSVEVVFPTILLKLFQQGQVYVYAKGDTTSKTISTLLLPTKYCRTSLKTQFGTSQIEFDFSFFDSFGLDEEEKVALLAVFPKEFVQKYDLYIANKPNYRWQTLNPKVSTAFTMNEVGFPTFLSIFYDIIDYKTYKLNELDRSTNKLERIVSQEIDLEKTGLELPEIEQLHDSMASVICANKGSTLVTSVGKIAVHQLQGDDGVQNETLDRAYNSIYSNAGMNYNMFNGDGSEALDASVRRDLAFVWSYVEQIVNFYNLAINNIVNFHDYQLSFRVLPISTYNEKEKLEFYHTNAEYGIGILDAVIASGIKQIDVESNIEMEEYLDLANRLVPLSSSHTLSSTSVDKKKAENKPEEKTSSPDEEKDTKDSDKKERVGDKDEL